MEWIIWVVVVLLVLFAAATVGIYLFTFYYPKKLHHGDFHYPDSPLFIPYKEQAKTLITEMRSLLCG